MEIRGTKRFTFLTLLVAMAIMLNVIESTYIGSFSFGIRIGLANIIALITIKILGIKEMLVVNVMRVMIGNLIRGLIFGSTFWISLGGVALSSIMLIILHKLNASIMFTSVGSSIAHSVGQVLVVMAFYRQPLIMSILPYLLLGSVPTGILTGYLAVRVIERIKPLKH